MFKVIFFYLRANACGYCQCGSAGRDFVRRQCRRTRATALENLLKPALFVSRC